MSETFLSGIILAYGVFMIGMLTPGPNILAVIGTAMSVGRSEGKVLALGIGTGTFCWALLTALGLSQLVAAYASIMTILKIAGAVYLLWLAYKAFKSALETKELNTRVERVTGGLGNYYMRGLIIQMTNAKAALIWIAIMSLANVGEAPMWVGAVLVVGAAIISLVGHVAYAFLFSTKSAVFVYSKARRWIEGLLGVYFCFASYKLATYRA